MPRLRLCRCVAAGRTLSAMAGRPAVAGPLSAMLGAAGAARDIGAAYVGEQAAAEEAGIAGGGGPGRARPPARREARRRTPRSLRPAGLIRPASADRATRRGRRGVDAPRRSPRRHGAPRAGVV